VKISYYNIQNQAENQNYVGKKDHFCMLNIRMTNGE